MLTQRWKLSKVSSLIFSTFVVKKLGTICLLCLCKLYLFLVPWFFDLSASSVYDLSNLCSLTISPTVNVQHVFPSGKKGKGWYSSLWEPHLRATGCHLPYGITQCYMPPDISERAPSNPSRVGWYWIYLPRRNGRLSWPSWLDSALAGSRTGYLSIMSPMPNRCTPRQRWHICHGLDSQCRMHPFNDATAAAALSVGLCVTQSKKLTVNLACRTVSTESVLNCRFLCVGKHWIRPIQF